MWCRAVDLWLIWQVGRPDNGIRPAIQAIQAESWSGSGGGHSPGDVSYFYKVQQCLHKMEQDVLRGDLDLRDMTADFGSYMSSGIKDRSKTILCYCAARKDVWPECPKHWGIKFAKPNIGGSV